MGVFVHVLLVAGVATLLACWCGWGLSRFLLPEALKLWGGLLAPAMGYALLLVFGYWCVRDWVGLPVVLAILVPVAGLLNAIAWWRTGPPRLSLDPRHLPLAALLLGTFLVGVLPILSYGNAGIIGANWDIENYLPVSRYLERGPAGDIATALPNPLRDLNASTPAIGLTLGFSVWQGSVDLLSGQEAITTFAVLMAWLRALGIATIYVLFRAVLGLRSNFALLGAGMISAGALLLWVQFFNFGMQIAAWPLLGLGLLLGIAAVEDWARRRLSAWPSLMGAGIALAALPVAYYPALTLFAPLAGGLVLAVLLGSRYRVAMLGAAGVLLALTLLLSIPAIYDYTQGFGFRYSQQLTTLGLFRYVPVTDFVGLTPFDLRSDYGVPVLSLVALGVLGALMMAGLAWGQVRWRWLGFVAGALTYLVWLRFENYPYAWMKGGAYAAFPFLGLAATGAQGLFDLPRPRLARIGGVAASALLLVLMGVTQARTVAANWDKPGLFADNLPAMLDLRKHIPEGSTVRLTSDPRSQGVTTALAAYVLDRARVIGNARTGYMPSWANGEADEIGDYGLLLAEEDPEEWGFSEANRLWNDAGFSLYKRDAQHIAQFPVARPLKPGQKISLDIGAGRIEPGLEDATRAVGDGKRGVVVALAALSVGSLTLGGREYKVPAGASLIYSDAIVTPRQFELANTGAAPITLRWARLVSGDTGLLGAPILGQPDLAVVSVNAQTAATTVTTTLNVALQAAGPLVLALDVYDPPRGLHYGWYGIEQYTSEASRALTLDLKTGVMLGVDGQGKALAIGGGPDQLLPGEYVARLQVLAGTTLAAAPVDVFEFKLAADGSVRDVEAVGESLVVANMNRPPVSLAVGVGDADAPDAYLAGYALGQKQARPGDNLPLTLWWHSEQTTGDERSILIHLRDASGQTLAQADGPPAGGGRPTSQWHGGEIIIDKHTLQIPPNLPPGNYNIAVGMYRFPSLEPLPLTQVGKPLDGNVVLIPIKVER